MPLKLTLMKRFLATALLALLTLSFTQAQEREMQRANKKFQQYAFIDSQQLYLRVADAGYESADLFGKLGDAFYFNAKYAKASEWYAKLVEKFPNEVTPDHYFRFAQSLRAEDKYAQSVEMIDKYNAIVSEEERLVYNETAVKEDQMQFIPDSYTISKLEINAKGFSDFSPAFYGDGQILFASTRDEGSFSKKIHGWNKQPFLDLYTADVTKDSIFNPQKLDGKINTRYHESSAVISPDGNTMYFTRNNYTKDEYRKAASGTNKLKLYKSTKNANGKWQEAVELPFNSDEYTVAHPALNADGTMLYFASDMPGSLGQSDIWSATINADGSYGEPENLGNLINTPGRETFPFMASNGDLYFSTDGRSGLGGLDVYVQEAETNEIHNLGKPINSDKDDFSFIVDQDSNTGYFASNRANDPLDDDIYSFVVNPCESQLLVKVIDKDSREPLAKAKIELRNTANDLLQTEEITALGEYNFIDKPCGENYFVRAIAEGYNVEEKRVSLPSDPKGTTVTFELVKTVTEVTPGYDIAKLLNPILFDFDKSYIRPDAAVELAKVIEVMKEYPQLRIDVRSHTDSRGNDAYNMALSQRRNDATIKYIVEKGGIDPDRLTGRGYGESQLLNDCGNGAQCTEAEHQLNRRSEFIVME